MNRKYDYLIRDLLLLINEMLSDGNITFASRLIGILKKYIDENK